MNHLVPVRSAVVATGLLAALASIPAAHATPADSSSASPTAVATTAPSPVPSEPATSAPTPAATEPPSAEPSAAPGADGTVAPSPVPSKDELAHTGSSNTSTTVMGAGAVVLVAGGAGALFAVRRRSHR